MNSKRYRLEVRLCGAAASVALAWGCARAARGDDSLAKYVPAQTGLFVEARDVEDLLTSLTEPQVWLTLAEMAGQPANEKEAQQWRERVRQTVKMEPDQAIRVLFARGVAFYGEGPARKTSRCPGKRT